MFRPFHGPSSGWSLFSMKANHTISNVTLLLSTCRWEKPCKKILGTKTSKKLCLTIFCDLSLCSHSMEPISSFPRINRSMETHRRNNLLLWIRCFYFDVCTCILHSLLCRPTNAQHTYINNILYIVSTATCFDALHHLQAVLRLKLKKLLRLQTLWSNFVDLT
jgi:hypothetical protein